MRLRVLGAGHLLRRRQPRAAHDGRPASGDYFGSRDAGGPVSAYLHELLDDTREELALADSKASLMLASSGVAVGALLAGLLGGGWTPFRLSMWIQWCWWLGACAAAAGIASIAAAVYPRIHRKETAHLGMPTYYGDVAKFDDVEDFRLAIGLRPDIQRRLLDQTFLLSRIVQNKYTLLRRGFILLLIAIIACISSVLINVPLHR
jgi:hypothetical protein